MTSTTGVICALIVASLAIRILLRRVFSVLDNIPGPPRKSILTGNLAEFHNPNDSDYVFQKLLEESYGQVVKMHGLLGDRQLFVFDPASLHSILIKDQDIWEEWPQFMWRVSYVSFSDGILSTVRDDHRKYRKIMMPAFSTANLRGMVPIFYEVAQRTRDGLIGPHVLDGPQTLDFNSILLRTSLELIGRTGIGRSFDPMLPGQEETDRYAKALRAMIPMAFKLQLAIPLLPLLVAIFPPSFRRFMIDFIPLRALHELRDVVDFTDATARELVRDRKAVVNSGNLDVNEGKDIMSLLVKGNLSANSAMHLTDEELVACTAMIVFGATDTTSSSMNRMFHLLATYPEVQERLRAEILAAPEQLDHDTLVALPYLDGVVRETLRLYPPVSPSVYRVATADTVLPLSAPITGVDRTAINSITVPKGTSVCVAIAAANHNKRIWGEGALEFRPDRWTNGKADSVTTKLCGIYGNTMTFIGGGRSCIGFKFAQLEMKVVACILLRAFKFASPGTSIQWRNTGIMLTPQVDNRSELPILVERLKV
ncbi:cytochrome P450 [Mycena capillaripes]|nr:cytochrome P450 [Mycena capillaripes]